MSDTIVRRLTQNAGLSEVTSTSFAAFYPRERKAAPAENLPLRARMVRLKRAIVQGVYHIDARRIAGKLLKRG
ncbi:MAG: flagellar biosynthesis anti-sigma factor FlgM [Gammaproteobacteria bacterium]|nr:flagellar biosynthesis anti-sigma factor FlgM [Gammaproteobacteria bacterium]